LPKTIINHVADKQQKLLGGAFASLLETKRHIPRAHLRTLKHWIP
jgi:hypothetical protein